MKVANMTENQSKAIIQNLFAEAPVDPITSTSVTESIMATYGLRKQWYMTVYLSKKTYY